MAEPTPGPWAIHRRPGLGDYLWDIVGPDGQYIASEGVDATPGDGHLIAAAPDLLASLCEMISWCSAYDVNFYRQHGLPEIVARANAALAKARPPEAP